MIPSITTSKRAGALVRGFLMALFVLGFLWAVGLRPDGRFNLILTLVIGISSALYFYDSSAADRKNTLRSQMLMNGVSWDFSSGEIEPLEEFVTRVSELQPANPAWKPDKTLSIRGPVEIVFATFYNEESQERVIRLEPVSESEWTQALLLHAIHRSLVRDPVASDSTFFEGLAMCGERRYRLFLGS